jgi:Zinc finger, ZZ type
LYYSHFFSEPNATIFRRFRLSSVASNYYDELLKQARRMCTDKLHNAVVTSGGEVLLLPICSLSHEVFVSKYKPVLLYTDPEGDQVCISSHNEVMEALRIYESYGPLKIMVTLTMPESTHNRSHESSTSGGETTVSPPPPPTPDPAAESNRPRPFIHGEHTCDACDVTPIVGRRYHATNDALNFDLCQGCYDNNSVGLKNNAATTTTTTATTGTATHETIAFEEAELGTLPEIRDFVKCLAIIVFQQSWMDSHRLWFGGFLSFFLFWCVRVRHYNLYCMG